jgi:hypothetical protein
MREDRTCLTENGKRLLIGKVERHQLHARLEFGMLTLLGLDTVFRYQSYSPSSFPLSLPD